MHFIRLFSTPISHTGICLPGKPNVYKMCVIPTKHADLDYLRHEQFVGFELYKRVVADITGYPANKYLFKRIDGERVLYETQTPTIIPKSDAELYNVLLFHYSEQLLNKKNDLLPFLKWSPANIRF